MSMWLKSSSHYKVPAALLLASLGAIFGMGFLKGGEQAAQGLVEYCVKQILFQWPVGMLVIFISSRLFEFDFGTIGTISLKVLAISAFCLALTVALLVFGGIPETSMITAAVDFVAFLFLVMILFGTGGLETWIVAAVSIALPYAIHHYIYPAVQAQLQDKPAATAPARGGRGGRR